MGLRAKLAGLIQTSGPGRPPPGLPSWTGSPTCCWSLCTCCFPVLLMDWNLGLRLMDNELLLDFLESFLDPLILTMGESGKAFNSASDIT